MKHSSSLKLAFTMNERDKTVLGKNSLFKYFLMPSARRNFTFRATCLHTLCRVIVTLKNGDSLFTISAQYSSHLAQALGVQNAENNHAGNSALYSKSKHYGI